MYKFFTSIILLLFLPGFVSYEFSRNEFYPVFAGNSLSDMELMVGKLDDAKYPAYKGGLLMKSAELKKNVSDKLSNFKTGRALLEKAIAENPNNAEWRFLRFAVQENAPAIVKYSSNLDEDKKMIISGFNKMDKDLQGFVLDYAASSALLNLSDLQK